MCVHVFLAVRGFKVSRINLLPAVLRTLHCTSSMDFHVDHCLNKSSIINISKFTCLQSKGDLQRELLLFLDKYTFVL